MLRVRQGMRVKFCPNPASAALYSYQTPDAGELGTVTTVSFGREKRITFPGPGGGLVYVKWDKHGPVGVSAYDLCRPDQAMPGLRGRVQFHGDWDELDADRKDAYENPPAFFARDDTTGRVQHVDMDTARQIALTPMRGQPARTAGGLQKWTVLWAIDPKYVEAADPSRARWWFERRYGVVIWEYNGVGVQQNDVAKYARLALEYRPGPGYTRGVRGKSSREGLGRVVSMTYGKLPDKRTFQAHYQRELGAGRYQLALNDADYAVAAPWIPKTVQVGPGDDYFIKHEFSLDAQQLYALLRGLVQTGSDEGLDLASSILSTLGFEWV